uniref:Uncharacterized protein n=1 Tax=Alexandrium monilatum TaxID=311494 RepID=A0A6T0XQG9_9DINO
MQAIASQAIATMNELKLGQLANLPWAYAALEFAHGPLLPAISEASIRLLRETATARPLELSCSAWSVAVFGFPDLPLLDALASAALRICSQFSVQELANTVWSYSTLA